MKKIAVIGAGISGLTIARHLSDKYDVTLFDKSRGIGGRVTTRYTDKYNFDHGAQFFIVKDERFQKVVDKLVEDKILDIWNAKFIEMDGEKVIARRKWNDVNPHYVATPKMNQMPKALGRDLNYTLKTRITSLHKNGDLWSLKDEEGNHQGEYDFVITAIPPIQLNDILSDNIAYKSKISDYKMMGCYSLMLGFNEPLNIDFDAALVKNADISWISVNSSKPQRSDSYCLLIHSTNKWAEENIELESAKAQQYLLHESSKIMDCDLSQHDYINIHKWRYANIDQQEGPEFFLDESNNIASIGDWFIRGRIESAFISATELYENHFQTI